MKIRSAPPNYGKQKVGKTFSQLGRLVGGEPRDQRGGRDNGVRVRKGRSR